MFLLKVGIFEIDYTLIILFFAGVFIALVLFALVFFILKHSTKNKSYMVKSKVVVSPDDGKNLIKKAEDEYNLRVKKGDEMAFEVLKDIANRLMDDIAKLFFPNSKAPLYELTIDELLDLLKTASRSAEEMLNEEYITKLLKGKFTISKIALITQKQEEEEQSPLEEYRNGFWSSTFNAIKSGFDKVKGAAIGYTIKKLDVVNRLFIMLIKLVGQETFDAFYKKQYHIDSNLDCGIEEIASELKRIANQESK